MSLSSGSFQWVSPNSLLLLLLESKYCIAIKQLPFRIQLHRLIIESKLIVVMLTRKTGVLLSDPNIRYCLRLVISGWKNAKSYAGVKHGQLGPRQREGGWNHVMEVQGERREEAGWEMEMEALLLSWAGEFTRPSIKHQGDFLGRSASLHCYSLPGVASSFGCAFLVLGCFVLFCFSLFPTSTRTSLT